MSVSSKEDCHYFYYVANGCNKVSCQYRHEAASKGQEKRCQEWLRTRKCSIPACPLRHKKLDKDRAKEPCFFERDSVCIKSDCPFFHVKPRPKGSVKKQSEDLFCPICNTTSPNSAALVEHLQGKKHLQKISQQLSAPPPNLNIPPPVPQGSKSPSPLTLLSVFHCKPCDVPFTNKMDFDSHFKSAAHKKKVNQPASKKIPTSAFVCKICNVKLRNKFFYDQHMNSDEHQAKVKGSGFKTASGNNSVKPLAKGNQPKFNQPPPSQADIKKRSPKSISESSSSTSLLKFENLNLNEPPPLADLKVGVFWDLENCPLSSKMDIPGVVQKLKKTHGNKGVLDQFVGACNMENHKRVAITMQELGMDILPVLNNKKNAADDLLKNKMMSFAENPRCRIILISGDVDFSQNLLHYREQKRHEVLLFHNDMAKESLKSVVTKAFRYQGFIRPFMKETADKPRSKSAVRGDKNRPKKTGKAVLFFWDMMSLPAPLEVTVGSVVSKLRNIFLCGTETIEAGFAACRSISQMGAVNHVAQMSVELSLDSPVDMLKHQLETKKDVDILILLTNDIGLGETIRKLKNERKIQIHLIRDEKCQEPLAYSLDEQSQESFQEFIKSLINPVSLGEKCEQGVPLNQNSALDSKARFLPNFFSKFATKEN